MLIEPARLQSFVGEIFVAAGSARKEAGEIAEHLVTSNLKGHDSHGVGLVPAYLQHLREGAVFPNRKPKCVSDLGAMIVHDGDSGYGQPTANAVFAKAGDRALETGVVVSALRNVQHVGRIGAYGEQLAARGLLSIHFVNAVYAQPCVAPFRGSDARLMTNPVCIAAPVGPGRPPVVLDFATSAIAMGKVRVAMNKGVETPENTLVDHKGNPTRDPRRIFVDPKGAILPFGLHKGWGLALVAEMLGGALAGGGTQAAENKPKGLVNGLFSIVIDQQRLIGESPYFDDVAELIDYVKASPPADPAAPVLVPGEPERETAAERAAGLPIDATTWNEISAAAQSVGVAAPRV
ncbi:MAG: malate/lactate/ureidoglycolate dehydrogenase [Rhodoblastus sp.]